MFTFLHLRLSLAAGAFAAATVAGAVTAGPAQSRPACEEALCAASVAQPAVYPSPYTEPMDVLGGRSHAEHLTDHMWPRLLRAGL